RYRNRSGWRSSFPIVREAGMRLGLLIALLLSIGYSVWETSTRIRPATSGGRNLSKAKPVDKNHRTKLSLKTSRLDHHQLADGLRQTTSGLLLLRLKSFVDRCTSALIDDDHFLHRFVACECDVYDVVSRSQQEIHWRALVEHATIHRNLRTLGRGFHADSAHASIRRLAAKQLLELADGLDLIHIAQRPQSR